MNIHQGAHTASDRHLITLYDDRRVILPQNLVTTRRNHVLYITNILYERGIDEIYWHSLKRECTV